MRGMKLTLSCGFGFEERSGENFDPSKLSWMISNLEASKMQDHKIEWI